MDHYISLDWAKNNMAIARMAKNSEEINVVDVPADLEGLKIYLKKLIPIKKLKSRMACVRFVVQTPQAKYV